ncbi:MAG: alanyl-tRNA editing protein [Candidatus Nanohalobium sp.]
MTELLYLPDNEYQKEFDAEVSKVKEDKGYICLKETLFYKEGGGQPADRGKISWNGGEADVVDVQKEHGEVRHYLDDFDELPEPGTEIHGEIDWERRYKHMRMHTAQHVLSWVVLNRYDASTAGNQIHEDYSRIDFEPADFSEENIEKIENQVNALIEKELEVEKKMMDRELVEERVQEGRTNLDIIPDNIDPLRVIIIGDQDLCPCGGTHVDNIDEIGKINITERKTKGADIERLKFELEE